MKIEKEIVAIGNSKGIILPTLTLEFLDVKEGDTLIIEDEEKNKGKAKAKPKIKDEVLIRKVENKLKNEPGKYNPGINLNV